MAKPDTARFSKGFKTFLYRYGLWAVVFACIGWLAWKELTQQIRDWSNVVTMIALAITLYAAQVHRMQDRLTTAAQAHLDVLISKIDSDPVFALQQWGIWSSSQGNLTLTDYNEIVAERYVRLVKGLRDKVPYLLFLSGQKLHNWREQHDDVDALDDKSLGEEILRLCSRLLCDSKVPELSPRESDLNHWLPCIYSGAIKGKKEDIAQAVEGAFLVWGKYQPVNEFVIQVLLSLDWKNHEKVIRGAIDRNFSKDKQYVPLLSDPRIHDLVQLDTSEMQGKPLEVNNWLPPFPSTPKYSKQIMDWLEQTELLRPVVSRPFDKDLLLHVSLFPDDLFHSLEENGSVLFFSSNQSDLLLGALLASYPQLKKEPAFPIRHMVKTAELKNWLQKGNGWKHALIKQIASSWTDFLSCNPNCFFELSVEQQESLLILFAQCSDHYHKLIERLVSGQQGPSEKVLKEHLQRSIHRASDPPDLEFIELRELFRIHPSGFRSSALILVFDQNAREAQIKKYLQLLEGELCTQYDPEGTMIAFTPSSVVLPFLNKICKLEWSLADLHNTLYWRLQYAGLDDTSVVNRRLDEVNPSGVSTFDTLFDFRDAYGLPMNSTPEQAVIIDAHGSLSELLILVDQIVQNHINHPTENKSLSYDDINSVCPLDVPREPLP